jgi:hypothetical protein
MKEKNTKKIALIIDNNSIIEKVYFSTNLKKILNKTKEEVINQIEADEFYKDSEFVAKVKTSFENAKSITDLKDLKKSHVDAYIFDVREYYFSFIDIEFGFKIILTTFIEEI